LLKELTKEDLYNEIEILKSIITDLSDEKREFKIIENELRDEIVKLMKQIGCGR